MANLNDLSQFPIAGELVISGGGIVKSGKIEGVDSTLKLGMKYDSDKPMAGLLFQDFPLALKGVVDVATFGAIKYAPHSWKTVPNAKDRYEHALFRHLIKLYGGEVFDQESKLMHSSHIAWNCLALSQMAFEALC